MYRNIFALCLFAFFAIPAAAQIEPYDLTVEYMTAPVGIDEAAPRLSWKSRATDPTLKNVVQTAYQVLVASSAEILASDKGDLWDTGTIESDQSLNIEYGGVPLETSQRCYWKVKVQYSIDGKKFEKTFDSPVSSWVMGVMRPEDWKAKWIGSEEKFRPDYDLHGAKWIWAGNATDLSVAPQGKSYFRTIISVGDVGILFDRAVLAITADDEYKVFINGKPATQTWGHLNDWHWMRFVDISEHLGIQPGHPIAGTGQIVLGVEVTNKSKGPTGLLAQWTLFGKKKDGTSGTASGMVDAGYGWLASAEPTEGWNSDPNFKNDKWKAAVEVGPPGCEPWGKIERRFETQSPAFYKEIPTSWIGGSGKLKHATLHITGLGFYEVYLDWKKVGNKVLDPAQTRYDKRVLYSTYDLTEYVEKQRLPNFITVVLGHGWYDIRSVAVWNFDNTPWRDFPRFIAQLELEFENGSKQYIVSDDSWKQIRSPIVFDCIRQGEASVGRLTRDELGCNAVVVDGPKGKLVAEAIPPSVIAQELKPVKISEPKPGVYVVDFGQNIAGWMRLRMKGPQTPVSSMIVSPEGRQRNGDIVRIRYAERLTEDGNIDMKPINAHYRHHVPFEPLLLEKFQSGQQFDWPGRPKPSGEIAPPELRDMFQTDLFLCRTCDSDGLNELTYEPRFMYHGFQYVEITGLREKPSPDWITGCMIHNDFKTVGRFECSNELFNKIQAATVLSYKGNFVNGVPTDCPHREKNGWTGDAQLASELAQYNFENTAAYEKWIDDLLDEQRDDGNLPGIVPTSGWGYAWGNGPAWDSAICIIPMMLYEYKGDRRILERAYPAMKKYVDYLTSRAKEDGLVYHGLSDWCPAKTRTDAVVTSSVYYFIDAEIVSRTAAVLGKKDDAQTYRKLAEKIRHDYVKKLLKEDGTVANGSQVAQSFALYYHLIMDPAAFSGFPRGEIDHDPVKMVFQKLVEAIEKADNHLDVGILGAKSLFHTLSRYGRTDLAMKILNQKTAPGYGDWFERGTTTLWEDWGDGASRNHIMFGDVSVWFFQTLAGIKICPFLSDEFSKAMDDEDYDAMENPDLGSWAFKGVEIRPEFPDGIDWVKAEHDSPYGPIKVDWKRDGKKIKLNFTVPPNTRVFFGKKPLGSGEYSLEFDAP